MDDSANCSTDPADEIDLSDGLWGDMLAALFAFLKSSVLLGYELMRPSMILLSGCGCRLDDEVCTK
jgi:hypothetical protein